MIARLAHSLQCDVRDWLRLAKCKKDLTDEMIQQAIRTGSSRVTPVPKRYSQLPGSETIATVEDLKFLEAMISSTKPLSPYTFQDLYEMLCRFRSAPKDIPDPEKKPGM